jgi:hypothetical protein
VTKISLAEAREQYNLLLASLSEDDRHKFLAELATLNEPSKQGTEAIAAADDIWPKRPEDRAGIKSVRDLLDKGPKGETKAIGWYLKDTSRITKEMDGKVIFFRNSVCSVGGYVCILYLYQHGERWCQDVYWIKNGVGDDCVLAVPASAV